jgi:Dullard-like phosphatase family protein
MPIKKEQQPPESININFTDNNRLEYLSKYINFEDFIILKQKMIDIKNTLSGKNLVINECFEYLNYYYNSSIYNNFEYLFANIKDINYLKIYLGYKILSIIICYNCSLDINVFEQTYLLLKEIIDLDYKCIILLFEYIFENILINNEDNKNNLWLLIMKNAINNFKLLEQKKAYNEYIQLNNESHMTILEKMKININFIVNNLNTILNNIKTKNSDYLLTLFKSINEEFYKNAFFYFFNYILRIINFQGSIIGSTIVQNHLLNNKNLMVPYIKTKNIKKYSLVLDLEETLLHFNMNITNNSEGVVNIRPGSIKFLDTISEYYELIVFNEGEQKYTDILIDSLEENKIYFEQRFYRDHVTIDNNDIVKDLIKIGRAFDKIIIVDNMPQNFKLQKENGIIIKSFWGDNPNDNILNELAIILIKIAKDGGDIRNGLIKYKNEIIKKILIGDMDNI